MASAKKLYKAHRSLYNFPQLIFSGVFLSTEISWKYIFAVFRKQNNPKTAVNKVYYLFVSTQTTNCTFQCY